MMAWNNGQARPEKKTSYAHKVNRGSLFENDQREKESSPDFKGTINVEGQVYWINGWKEVTGKGIKRLSLSVQRQEPHMQERAADPQPPRQPQSRGW